MRAHQNFVEGFGPTILLLLVAGLAPTTVWVAVGVGWMYFIARIIYAWGYVRATKDGEGPFVGGVMIDLCLLALFGMAIYVCVRMMSTQA